MRPLIRSRFASLPCSPATCPKFRGSRSWLLNPRRSSGISWFLPAFVGRRAKPTASRRRTGAKGNVEYVEGARGCAAQRSRRGEGSVYAAKGPGDRARGATVRTRGGRRTTGQNCRGDEGSGPCANACGPSHAPDWARRPADEFRRKSSLHGAQRRHRVPTIRAVHHGPALPSLRMRTTDQRCAPAGHQRDRQSNDLSPGYWMFLWHRRKLRSDARSQYLRGQHGNRVRNGQRQPDRAIGELANSSCAPPWRDWRCCMDLGTSTDSALRVVCPQCGHSEIDDLELLAGDEVHALTCEVCSCRFHLALFECAHCGGDGLRPGLGADAG